MIQEKKEEIIKKKNRNKRGFNQLDRHLYNLFDFLIIRVGFIFFDTFINILSAKLEIIFN
ncbi:hypothetical protein BpHYR1_042469 [Brachionus plicatilis]|uniref:Uncharacterized protein n=1 Tax=Brachionus plicatilis TaxID=10195 RepID=A0A3M7PFD8_BRAPC|nr:hypothetical protein BpHYR1_042469 [Brachionus plicatilis]